MSERDKIFGRIKEALRFAAPHPDSHDHNVVQLGRTSWGDSFRAWLPKGGHTFEDRLRQFEKNAADLRAEFRLFETMQQLTESLAEASRDADWKKIGTHSGALTDQVRDALGLPACLTDHPYDVQELEGCDAGITECDALVAQTGSVLVTNRSAGGRALSVLPAHHVVLARRDQLLRDLAEALTFLQKRYGADYPSFCSFITGPSRTGDIERVLVLGAHGPKKLTIYCV